MTQRLVITVLLCFLSFANDPVTAQWFLGNIGGQGQGQGPPLGLFGPPPPPNQGGQVLLGLIANAVGQATTPSPTVTTPRVTSTTTKVTSSSAAIDIVDSGVIDVRSEEPHETSSNSKAFETVNPCVSEVVTMTRVQGELTPEINYWVGNVDLSDYSYLKTIKLVIKVDNPARIVVDPRKGQINGPVRGTIFRVTYFGSPPEVSDVNFKIFGASGKNFPNLVSLHLSNRDICRGPTAVVDRVASTLDEVGVGMIIGQSIQNLFGVLDSNTHQGVTEATEATEATATKRPTTKKPLTTVGSPRRTSTAPARTCGRRLNQREAYIVAGYESRPGDWPWHAALYHRDGRNWSYKCGGSLINDQTVVTAAHCVFSFGKELVPSRVSVHLGKHNLNVIDSNTEEYQVDRIKIHPEYSAIDLQDDLAILKLANRVTFTNYIQPVCLWPKTEKELSHVVGKKGYVVGWGLTEDDGLAEVLNEGTMPVVDFFECLESNRDFFGPVLSDFNYCAGYRNGTSVCNGDSGGGMFFENNGSWTIRGLVSFSSVRPDRDVCNPENFVIFTDVAKYHDWINTN